MSKRGRILCLFFIFSVALFLIGCAPVEKKPEAEEKETMEVTLPGTNITVTVPKEPPKLPENVSIPAEPPKLPENISLPAGVPLPP